LRQGNFTTSDDRRAVFVLLCIAIVAVIIDASIVKIYRFITAPLSLDWDIATFIIIAIIYAVAHKKRF
jgi:hypothetical protein